MTCNWKTWRQQTLSTVWSLYTRPWSRSPENLSFFLFQKLFNSHFLLQKTEENIMGLNLEEIKTKKKLTFIGLGLGQIISLLCTCNVFTSSELARKGLKLLLFMVCYHYYPTATSWSVWNRVLINSSPLFILEFFLGINVPTTQSFLTYTLLAIVYGGIMLYKRPTIKVSLEVSSFTLMSLS